MPNEPQDPTTVEPNATRNIADGLADHIFKSRNSENRDIVTGTTTKAFLVALIKEYLDGLDSIEQTYDRAQMLQDLIIMVKGGNAAAAKQVTDLLGLDNASELYEINIIDFKDTKINDEFFEVK